MPRLKHVPLTQYPYMATTVTANRKRIFKNAKAADILLEAILFGKKQEWYYLLSFVIMPDHFHLILIPESKDISHCMQSIKGFSSRQINKVLNRRGTIWQEGFYDYILDSEEKVLSRIKYIEDNPVRKGIVINSKDYPYSSIRYRDYTDFRIFF